MAPDARSTPEGTIAVILFQSREKRRRWRANLDEEALKGARDEVISLIADMIAAGSMTGSEYTRSLLEAEIASWRDWLAERGEYVPRQALRPPAPVEELREISREQLFQTLNDEGILQGRIVRGVIFANHLPELRQAFSDARIVNCRFEDCQFDGAEFGEDTRLIYTGIVNSSLNNLGWPGVRASSLALRDLDIVGARFQGGSFADVLFRNFHSREGTDFSECNFTFCRFEGVAFEGTNMTAAIFSRCVFGECTFRGVDLAQAVFSDCDLRGTVFEGGTLRDAIIDRSELAGMKFVSGPLARRTKTTRRRATDLTGVRAVSSFNLPQPLIDQQDLESLGSGALNFGQSAAEVSGHRERKRPE